MNNKTISVAIYPDGKEYIIRRERLGWNFEINSWSSHYDSAVRQVELKGGRVERRPNPDYKEPDVMDQIWKMIFG